jgi:hypothetical protein
VIILVPLWGAATCQGSATAVNGDVRSCPSKVGANPRDEMRQGHYWQRQATKTCSEAPQRGEMRKCHDTSLLFMILIAEKIVPQVLKCANHYMPPVKVCLLCLIPGGSSVFNFDGIFDRQRPCLQHLLRSSCRRPRPRLKRRMLRRSLLRSDRIAQVPSSFGDRHMAVCRAA